jgi:hypothetical protein
MSLKRPHGYIHEQMEGFVIRKAEVIGEIENGKKKDEMLGVSSR